MTQRVGGQILQRLLQPIRIADHVLGAVAHVKVQPHVPLPQLIFVACGDAVEQRRHIDALLAHRAAASFEALQKLEAPTFDQIFKNEELRREFENLTRKLDAPSS